MDAKLYHRMLVYALLGGLASVLMDMDHIPQQIGIQTPDRPLHFAIAVGALLVGCLVLGVLSLKRVGSRASTCQS